MTSAEARGHRVTPTLPLFTGSGVAVDRRSLAAGSPPSTVTLRYSRTTVTVTSIRAVATFDCPGLAVPVTRVCSLTDRLLH